VLLSNIQLLACVQPDTRFYQIRNWPECRAHLLAHVLSNFKYYISWGKQN